jgi:hypothetical protein
MLDREASFKMLSEATTRLKMDVQKGVVDIQNKSKVKTMKWWKKVHGGHASIPPSFNTTQCLWTFVGVFVTHVILSKLGVFLARRQYHLVIGPLGALTTLQYNLTAAPARYVKIYYYFCIRCVKSEINLCISRRVGYYEANRETPSSVKSLHCALVICFTNYHVWICGIELH